MHDQQQYTEFLPPMIMEDHFQDNDILLVNNGYRRNVYWLLSSLYLRRLVSVDIYLVSEPKM